LTVILSEIPPEEINNDKIMEHQQDDHHENISIKSNSINFIENTLSNSIIFAKAKGMLEYKAHNLPELEDLTNFI
jgi:hypothetical protein